MAGRRISKVALHVLFRMTSAPEREREGNCRAFSVSEEDVVGRALDPGPVGRIENGWRIHRSPGVFPVLLLQVRDIAGG